MLKSCIEMLDYTFQVNSLTIATLEGRGRGTSSNIGRECQSYATGRCVEEVDSFVDIITRFVSPQIIVMFNMIIMVDIYDL